MTGIPTTGTPATGTPATDDIKDIARRWFERFSQGDLAGAFDLVDPDARWWLAGKPERLATAGWYTRDGFEQLMARMTAGLTGGLTMTVTSAIAEGDRVALEVVSHGELRNGRAYDNEYHVLMQITGGRIRCVREYHDTQHVHDVWLRPDEPPPA